MDSGVLQISWGPFVSDQSKGVCTVMSPAIRLPTKSESAWLVVDPATIRFRRRFAVLRTKNI
jgi:hypothetical protein